MIDHPLVDESERIVVQALSMAVAESRQSHRFGVAPAVRLRSATDSYLHRPDAKRWVLKGATAILARLAGNARHTRDIDPYRQDEDLHGAENSLRAATDAGDFFRFTLDPAERITQDRHTLRVSTIAYLGLRELSRFHVDLVTNLTMTVPSSSKHRSSSRCQDPNAGTR